MVIIIFILLQYPIDPQFRYTSDKQFFSNTNLQGLK